MGFHGILVSGVPLDLPADLTQCTRQLVSVVSGQATKAGIDLGDVGGCKTMIPFCCVKL